MATLESPESNILEAEAINWRLIVYPLVLVLLIVAGGFTLYTYLESQRELREDQARQALLQAKTPAALVQVADQFSGTTNSLLALIQAATLSFDQNDFPNAEKYYQRVIDTVDAPDLMRDSARLGLASVQEAAGKRTDAVATYLVVGRRGNATPYAPYAYYSAAQLDEQAKDTNGERQILVEASALGGDSPFVKEAQNKLRSMSMSMSDSPASLAPGGPAAPH